MSKKNYSKVVLHISFILVLFYPLKGLISLFLSLLIGADVSSVIIRLSLFCLLSFLSLNIAVNKISLSTKTDKLLFFIGIIGSMIGFLKGDTVFIYTTVLLFILPVLLSEMRQISDRIFYKYLKSFFIISTLYMFIEHIILHPSVLGLSFQPLPEDKYASYLNYLFVGALDASALVTDYRHQGAFVRTGGYLVDLLVMPVILSMTAMFFYVLVREKAGIFNIIFSLLSFYLLAVSLSTTAIISFLLSLLYYEIFVKRIKLHSLLTITFISLFIGVAFISPAGTFVYNRLLVNLADQAYYNTFFDYSGLLKPVNIFYLIFGKWNWEAPDGVSSHIDLIMIPLSYGVIICFMLYKKILYPVINLRTMDIYSKLFSLSILPAFICLYHHQMTLNINVMFLFTLLLVKNSNSSLNCSLPQNYLIKKQKSFKKQIHTLARGSI